MKTCATSSALTSGGTFTPVSTVSTPTAIPAPMTDAESPGQALTAFLDHHQARQWMPAATTVTPSSHCHCDPARISGKPDRAFEVKTDPDSLACFDRDGDDDDESPAGPRPRRPAGRRGGRAPARIRVAGARRAGGPGVVYGIVGVLALNLAVGSGGTATTRRHRSVRAAAHLALGRTGSECLIDGAMRLDVAACS